MGLALADPPACPQVQMGISPNTGSGRNPAADLDLYRHTSTPAAGFGYPPFSCLLPLYRKATSATSSWI